VIAPNPTVYGIDGIANSMSTVDELHRRGERVICYIEVGVAGSYYSTSEEHQRVGYYTELQQADDLGRGALGYPERYLSINTVSTATIIK
jgi:Glycoside-hydrolase family GH114